jgi:hypothetical protein
MSERFNVSGPAGRNCPLCFRVGSLVGARDGDAPRLTCSGCLTVFRLTWTTDDLSPDTLTRVTAPAPATPYPPPGARP